MIFSARRNHEAHQAGHWDFVPLGRQLRKAQSPRIELREFLFLIVVFLLLVELYHAVPGPLFYYDAHVMVPELYKPEFSNELLTRHFLILPIGRAIMLLTGLPPEDALALFSAISAAATPVFVYMGLRWLGYGSPPALFASALIALAPGTVFFGLHIEKHGPHAAAVAGAFAVACRNRGSTSLVRCLIPVLLSAVFVTGTHVSGILRFPFIGLLGFLNTSGAKPRAYLLVTLPIALLAVAGGVILLGCLLGWWVVTENTPLAPFLVIFRFPWRFDLAWIATYVMRTVVPGGAVLLPVGLIGLALLVRRAPRIALPCLAWFVCVLYAFTAYGWIKEGAHVLPAYVTLVAGAAEFFRRMHLRFPRFAVGLAVLAVAVQSGFATRKALEDAGEPHPLTWARSLRETTGNKGYLVTDWQAHCTIARLHSRVNPVTMGVFASFGSLEEARRKIPLFISILEGYLRAGKSVYLDEILDRIARSTPEILPMLRAIRSHFRLTPVGDESFHAWRLFLRE